MQYLWEKTNRCLNVYALAVNRKKLAEYREFQLVHNIPQEKRVYRYVTNTSRYKSILSSRAITYEQLIETEKHILIPDGYGRLEEYNNGQFLSGKILPQEKLLQLYYNGFYDKNTSHVVGIASKLDVLPTEEFLVTKSLVQKFYQPAGKFELLGRDITIVDGIIALPPSLATLEHMLRSNEISSYLQGKHNEYLSLFALSHQPVKTYTEREIAEIFELSGKEIVSEKRVERDAKVLEKLKNPTNGIIRF